MKSRLDALTGSQPLLVLDASVVINLLATDRCGELLAALPGYCLIETAVRQEVYRLPGGTGDVGQVLDSLEAKQLLETRELGAQGLEDFEAITEGPIRDTLGDGEAATLALAAEIGAMAVIDENKATRIAGEKYQHEPITLLHSLDLFACQAVQQRFRDDLPGMVLRALQFARMRVPIAFEGWVLALIGPEEFQRCTSIRLRARNDVLGH